jgi:hypothetical protein
LPNLANAQVWGTSGFKVDADSGEVTAYCSTSDINPNPFSFPISPLSSTVGKYAGFFATDGPDAK